MSVSCFDCFSDLLCDEDSSKILPEESPGSSSELESTASLEESIAGFIEDERQLVPEGDYLLGFQSKSMDASARAESVAWILKVQDCYGFQPLTAYLSVNYLDRFLHSRRLPESLISYKKMRKNFNDYLFYFDRQFQANGWPIQLLSVACLSLAAKIEETMAPSLLDLQVEGAKFIFESKTVFRMELFVLSVLEWRLRSITPFSFIGFFACKLDPTGTFTGFLVSRAGDIILSSILEASFLVHRPSCIAVAALLCAANEIPSLSLANPGEAEMWCKGLSKEKIICCYRLMQESIGRSHRRSTQPKILPQPRVTTICTRRRFSDSSLSSLSSPQKRRRLNNC